MTIEFLQKAARTVLCAREWNSNRNSTWCKSKEKYSVIVISNSYETSLFSFSVLFQNMSCPCLTSGSMVLWRKIKHKTPESDSVTSVRLARPDRSATRTSFPPPLRSIVSFAPNFGAASGRIERSVEIHRVDYRAHLLPIWTIYYPPRHDRISRSRSVKFGAMYQ